MPTMKKLPATPVAGPPAPKKTQPTHLVGIATVRKDGKSRVYWRQPDYVILADAMVPLIDGDTPLSVPQALKRAQEQLPENRRRPVYSVPAETWIPDALKAARKRRERLFAQRRAEQERAESEAAKSVREGLAALDAKKAAQEPAQAAEAPTPAPEAIAQPQAPVPALGATLAHAWQDLRGLIVNELASILVEAGLKAMGSAMLGKQQISVEPAGDGAAATRVFFQRAPSPARKPSLLVVGLQTNWRTVIDTQFRDKFDLKFYSTDESKDALRHRADSAATVVMMTDHISHSHAEIAKSRAAHLIPQAGGVNQLRETLSSLAARTH